MEFKSGEKVQLNSGGPEMTVQGLVGNDTDFSKQQNVGLVMAGNKHGDVVCQWFNGSEVKSAIFKPTMLKKV